VSVYVSTRACVSILHERLCGVEEDFLFLSLFVRRIVQCRYVTSYFLGSLKFYKAISNFETVRPRRSTAECYFAILVQ